MINIDSSLLTYTLLETNFERFFPLTAAFFKRYKSWKFYSDTKILKIEYDWKYVLSEDSISRYMLIPKNNIEFELKEDKHYSNGDLLTAYRKDLELIEKDFKQPFQIINNKLYF